MLILGKQYLSDIPNFPLNLSVSSSKKKIKISALSYFVHLERKIIKAMTNVLVFKNVYL